MKVIWILTALLGLEYESKWILTALFPRTLRNTVLKCLVLVIYWIPVVIVHFPRTLTNTVLKYLVVVIYRIRFVIVQFPRTLTETLC